MKPFILIGWLLLGLYFGTGGITKMENYNLIKSTIAQSDTARVIYKGVPFQNKGALLRQIEQEEMDSIFPWVDALPSYVSYIITACAFGLLGTLINLFIQLSLKGKSLSDLPVLSLPILGILTGLVVLGISLIFPALLFNSEKDLKASGLMFMCLFAGTFVDTLYNRLSTFFEQKILQKDSSNTNSQ